MLSRLETYYVHDELQQSLTRPWGKLKEKTKNINDSIQDKS
jgi:hypothetical protein